MNIEFKQKRGLSSRYFVLSEHSLEVKTKTISRIAKYEVRLDKIGYEKNYQADNVIVGKISFWICLIIPFILFGRKLLYRDIDEGMLAMNSALFLLIAFLLRFKQHQDDIVLVGGATNIHFFRNYPSEKDVLEFIDIVIASAKQYQKNRALDPDLGLSQELYIARIHWLRENEIIDSEEFSALLLKYNFDQNFAMN